MAIYLLNMGLSDTGYQTPVLPLRNSVKTMKKTQSIQEIASSRMTCRDFSGHVLTYLLALDN